MTESKFRNYCSFEQSIHHRPHSSMQQRKVYWLCLFSHVCDAYVARSVTLTYSRKHVSFCDGDGWLLTAVLLMETFISCGALLEKSYLQFYTISLKWSISLNFSCKAFQVKVPQLYRLVEEASQASTYVYHWIDTKDGIHILNSLDLGACTITTYYEAFLSPC